jgi:ABC-type branched-subunit amino acid transport system substrate-binding protein
MKKKLVILVALMLVATFTLALVACGPENKPQGAQGVYEDKIVIANSATTSGTYGAIGLPFLAGIRGYLNMINEAGGIDGRKIEFINQDDEFLAEKGIAALEKFVEQDEVFAIVGHFGTPVVGATLDMLKEYGIPAVYFATGIGQLFSEKATTNEEGYNIFPVQPLYITEGQVMVARAVGTFGAKKIGMIYTNDDAGKNMLDGAQAMAAKLNVELVVEQVTAGAADVSAAVTKIMQANVDFVISGAIQATTPTIVKELAAQGNTKGVITTYVCASVAVSDAVKDSIAGKFDLYSSSWKSRTGEYAADFELFKTWVDPTYVDNTDAESGWVAAHVFCEGLKRLVGEEVTWESYMKALEEAPIDIPFGGEISFADGARKGVSDMLLSKVNSTVDGGWEVVYPMDSMENIIAGK